MGALGLPEILTTARLVLRPTRFEDLADILAFARDAEYGRFLPLPNPYTESDARRFIAAQMLLDRATRHEWAIELDRRAIGGINVRFFEQDRVAELGYSMGRSYWGRGLATEATRAVVDAAFTALPGLGRVRAMANVLNVASCRVLEKCGFRREGILRANRFIRGEPVDEAWFGLLRSEWQPGG